MNMLEGNRKIASVLIDKMSPNMKLGPKEPSDDINENAHQLEITKELMSAIKENKPEKACRALMMLIKACYDEYEEKEDEENDETPDSE